MVNARKILLLLLLMALTFTGCAMATVEELYCLPKRSEEYENIQAVIDKAMQGLTYSAPIYGDNRHFLQVADLDGDGIDEYLVFAKDNSDKPLKIMIFCQLASGCVLMDTIEGYGFGFDFVSYAQMDDRPGVELIVGRQVSDQVMRSVSVYRFTSGFARQLLNTSYNEITTTDMDLNGVGELLLLSAGPSEKSAGSAKLYSYRDGELQRSAEIQLSASMNGFQLLHSGVLQDGTPAIYVTCSADSQKLVTDIFVHDRGDLLAFAKGITVATLDNYYVYPQDLDNDSVLELPRLVELPSLEEGDAPQYLIEWYSLDSQGNENKKFFTYHHYPQNWYLDLEKECLSGLSVRQSEHGSTIYYEGKPYVTILALTDADREEQSQQPDCIILHSGETVIYVAVLHESEIEQDISKALLTRFHSIRVELNTEED